MIRGFDRSLPELREIIEVPATDEERAQHIREHAEWDLNVDWFNVHAAEIYRKHAGKYLVVLGQELFVGPDPVEVWARAKAAHPELAGGGLCRPLPNRREP